MIRHFTASAVIVADGHVLLICHRKGDGWIYPGGHLEPGEDSAQAVLREVREEAGIPVELITDHRFAHPRVDAVPLPFAILAAVGYAATHPSADVSRMREGPVAHVLPDPTRQPRP